MHVFALVPILFHTYVHCPLLCFYYNLLSIISHKFLLSIQHCLNQILNLALPTTLFTVINLLMPSVLLTGLNLLMLSLLLTGLNVVLTYFNINRIIPRWSWHNMWGRILSVFKYVCSRTVYSFLSFLFFPLFFRYTDRFQHN